MWGPLVPVQTGACHGSEAQARQPRGSRDPARPSGRMQLSLRSISLPVYPSAGLRECEGCWRSFKATLKLSNLSSASRSQVNIRMCRDTGQPLQTPLSPAPRQSSGSPGRGGRGRPSAAPTLPPLGDSGRGEDHENPVGRCCGGGGVPWGHLGWAGAGSRESTTLTGEPGAHCLRPTAGPLSPRAPQWSLGIPPIP